MKAFINGEVLPQEDVKLHISDLSIQRGFAIFDFFRTKNFVPLFLDDYLKRFFDSAAAMHLKVPYSKHELFKIVKELISVNQVPDAGFKMILTGGYSEDGYKPSYPNFIVQQLPLHMSTLDDFERGMSVITFEHLRHFPAIKSTSYLTGVWLQPTLKKQQADDVLYTYNNHVLEFPRSNVFVVKDDVLLTPNENVLEGITRLKVMELAKKFYRVEKRTIRLDELSDASEVFLTSTTKRVLPVLKINGTAVGSGQPGEVTRKLYHTFIELENEYERTIMEKHLAN